MKSTKQAWQQDVDVYDRAVGDWDNNASLAGNQEASGQDLKGALKYFNQGQLAVSSDGASVGWNTGTGVVNVHSNDLDSFWLTLHQQGMV